MGLHPSQIVLGYEDALKECLKLLNTIESFKIENLRN